MSFKVSFFFVQQVAKSGGWSENYWNVNNDLNAVVTLAGQLGLKLMAVHGHSTYVQSIRYSEVGAFRRSVIAPQTFTFNPEVANSVVSDYPTTALLLRLTANPNYVTNQWIKGIPDAQVTNGGFYAPTGDYVNRMNALWSQLLNGANGWQMRVIDKDVPKKPINAISATGEVTLPNHGYADGDMVRISRAKGYTFVNRVWRIIYLTANSFQLAFYTAPVTPTPIYGNPVAQKQVYKFVAPTGVNIIRATEHKVGRPFALLSGRRKARAS